jgi:hypothetical protein
MKCPSCHKRACAFLDWMKGPRAIAHECPHCGQALRASVRTWIVLAAMFAMIPLVIQVTSFLCDKYGVDDFSARKGAFAVCWFGVMAVFSFAEWRTGSYRVMS